MNQVMNTTQYTQRPSPRPYVALGNNHPRYNSHIEGVRKKFFINSTRNSNSEDTPQWMGRTDNFYKRKMSTNRQLFNKDGSNKSGMYSNTQGIFESVRQTNIYENVPKYAANQGGHFYSVMKKKPRSHWEMKNHSFELQWPKKEQRKSSIYNKSGSIGGSNFSNFGSDYKTSRNNRSFILQDNPQHRFSRTSRDMSFSLPKYGIRETPLHVQKQTPLKIGHSLTVDTYQVK